MPLHYLTKSESKLIAIKGLLCALFGLISIFVSDNTYTLLAYAFGSIALANGLITVLSTIYSSKTTLRNFSVWHFEGIASFITGVLVLCFPKEAISVFMSILGTVAVGMGIAQFLLAVDLKTYKLREGLLFVSGALTIFLGMVLIKNPNAISSFVTILLGLFFVVTGGYTTYFAYKSITKPSPQKGESAHPPSIRIQPSI